MTDQNRKIFVLGALSAMARESARVQAGKGASLYLVGRDGEALRAEADDLRVRGAVTVDTLAMDLTDTIQTDTILANASAALGGLDTILLFYGVLGDQAGGETDPGEAARIMDVTYTSAAQWVLAGARHLEAGAKSRGVLMTASSVAGDRGRRSNFVYGSAKAGLSVLMQGLAHKWGGLDDAPRAVNLKLGFVDTPMTSDVEKGGPLWASPEDIAAIVDRAIEKGGPTVYAPWFWRFIMLAVRATPHFIFKRVNL